MSTVFRGSVLYRETWSRVSYVSRRCSGADLFELIPIPLERREWGGSLWVAAGGGVGGGGYSYAICQKGSRTQEIPQFILPYVTRSRGNGR